MITGSNLRDAPHENHAALWTLGLTSGSMWATRGRTRTRMHVQRIWKAGLTWASSQGMTCFARTILVVPLRAAAALTIFSFSLRPKVNAIRKGPATTKTKHFKKEDKEPRAHSVKDENGAIVTSAATPSLPSPTKQSGARTSLSQQLHCG
jgi:hypothetical protein